MDFKKFWTDTLLTVTGLVLLAASGQVAADERNNVEVGDPFPIVNFPVPNTSPECNYLGVSASAKTFTLSQIKACVVVLEIFNVYCPHCQAEAPNVNELVARIKSSGLSGQVKFLGVGANNSPFEVAAYQEKYHVTFPLLPDPDLDLYHAIGDKQGTPFFIAVRLRGNGDTEIFYSQAGPLPKTEAFLGKIKEKAALQ